MLLLPCCLPLCQRPWEMLVSILHILTHRSGKLVRDRLGNREDNWGADRKDDALRDTGIRKRQIRNQVRQEPNASVLDTKRGLSIVQRNLQQEIVNQGRAVDTQFYYDGDIPPEIILITKPKFIIANNNFGISILLSHSLKIEQNFIVELFIQGSTISSVSKWDLDTNSLYNQNYLWNFAALINTGDYALRYWIWNPSINQKVSNVFDSNEIISVLPVPILNSALPNLLEINSFSGYIPVRLFGENLRTDFAKIWFGDKAQTTFLVSDDGTYIDVNAPITSLLNNQDRIQVNVYIQINEDQYTTNSISVTYFRLIVNRLYYAWSSNNAIWSQSNEIVYNDNGQLIGYADSLLVETPTGEIR